MNYEELFPLEDLPPGTPVAEAVAPITKTRVRRLYHLPVNRRSQMNRGANRLFATMQAQQSAIDMEILRIYGFHLPVDEDGKYFIYLEDPQSVETGKKPKIYRSSNPYDFVEKVPAAIQRRARTIFTQMHDRAVKAEERIAREEVKEYYKRQLSMERRTRKAVANAAKRARASETRRRRAGWMRAANEQLAAQAAAAGPSKLGKSGFHATAAAKKAMNNALLNRLTKRRSRQ
jgi:hypothetical protein